MKVARRLAASVLAFESLVVCFAIAVAVQISDVRPVVAVPAGLVLAAACLLTSGMLGRRGGYLVGHVLQVLIIACGFVVPAMFFLGAVFAGLWVTAIVLGRKIAAVEAAREQEAASTSGTLPGAPEPS